MARPLIYKTVEEMQNAIDEYFKSCEGKPLLDKDGNPVLDKWSRPIMIGKRPPTVTGLALALGFKSRQALLNYQAREPFNDAVTRAKSRVEQYAEERLFDKDGVTGAKFTLTNNFSGWKEKPTDDDRAAIEALDNILKSVSNVMKND